MGGGGARNIDIKKNKKNKAIKQQTRVCVWQINKSLQYTCMRSRASCINVSNRYLNLSSISFNSLS